MSPHPSLALIVLAALAVGGIILLAAIGSTIPDVLSGVAIAGVAGGAGAAYPAVRTTTTTPQRKAAP